jgi:serine/threonine protein kinase
VGPYEITASLGAGGMGEVYRARDARLNRDVAIKILPAAFANDPTRMARFEREAQMLAALNHPNIAAIYGIEEGALVMELVEGDTLAERIARGPIPLDETLGLARQIADGLAAAHDKSIIHRDLKPANIKITPEGKVKILDFGLAKAFESESATSISVSNSPTLTLEATRTGMILGTAGYMAPEQARGRPVDKRADIWAFGVIAYEMLTGKELFQGETVSDTLAAVLKEGPDWNRAPVEVRRLLRSCLEKDPARRLRDIGDAWRLLEEEAPAASPPRSSRLSWVLVAVTTVVALVLAFVHFRSPGGEPRILRFTVPLPETAPVISFSVISPDARHLAFLVFTGGRSELWVRDLDSFSAGHLLGIEGAGYPFWSPDSRNIAFFEGGKLKRISVSGGPPLFLCDAESSSMRMGGSWSKNDVILFVQAGGTLWRVAATGGDAKLVASPDRSAGESIYRFPWFLPDGKHFLYTAASFDPEKSAVYVSDLESKGRRQLLSSNFNAVYAHPGYLLFVRDQNLMAQAFDASKLAASGDAFPIAEQVDSLPIGLSQFSVSENGTLAYTSGGALTNSQLTWYDRSGTIRGIVGPAGVMRQAAISPDGSTVAVDRRDPHTGSWDVWLHDLARGTDSRFTLDSRVNLYRFPVWSGDGRHIAFLSAREHDRRLYQKTVGGSAADEILDPTSPEKKADDWSRDGRYVIEETYSPDTPKTGSDIWVLPLFGDRKPYAYVQTEFNERNARLSPNGQWLAYDSNRSKRLEIYVESFPTRGRLWQVSTNGGTNPVWSRDGKELFFIGADRKLMSVEVKNGVKFDAGQPRPLFDMRLPLLASFDVSKDGRFLMPVLAAQTGSTQINVVVNWHAGLKR